MSEPERVCAPVQVHSGWCTNDRMWTTSLSPSPHSLSLSPFFTVQCPMSNLTGLAGLTSPVHIPHPSPSPPVPALCCVAGSDRERGVWEAWDAGRLGRPARATARKSLPILVSLCLSPFLGSGSGPGSGSVSVGGGGGGGGRRVVVRVMGHPQAWAGGFGGLTAWGALC